MDVLVRALKLVLRGARGFIWHLVSSVVFFVAFLYAMVYDPLEGRLVAGLLLLAIVAVAALFLWAVVLWLRDLARWWRTR